MIIIIALLVSLIPPLLLYLYLKNLKKEDPEYGKDCRTLLISGILCSFGVALLSFLATIIWGLLGPEDQPVLKEIFRTFVVAALSEEIMKYLSANRILRKNHGKASWIDCIAWFAIVGCGFQMIETVLYSIGAIAPELLVRGVTLGHPSYGMIMGYFMGRYLYTGKKSNQVFALLAPFLLHGLYDFSLSNVLTDINDNFIFLPLLMVIIEVGSLIRFLRLIRKERKKENSVYTMILPERTDG